MKKIIATEKAPKAIGPYSQAVACGNFLFTSGQLGLDPATGDFAKGGVTEQTEQVISNLKAVIEKAGFTLNDVVKATCFLADIHDFAAMNEVYKKYFTGDFPARSAFAIKSLPKGGLVEIEAICYKD